MESNGPAGQRLRLVARRWRYAAQLGIVGDEMSYASIPAGQVRERLLANALQFIREAQRIPAVLRIALIGSVVSPKLAPKDVDLLITVQDDADLTLLAQAGRRLKGRCQTFNCGADIFLANEEQRYIGRICHWRECRPGVRASCDAEHCGRRAFLHDDVRAVRLKPDLVSAPRSKSGLDSIAAFPCLTMSSNCCCLASRQARMKPTSLRPNHALKGTRRQVSSVSRALLAA